MAKNARDALPVDELARVTHADVTKKGQFVEKVECVIGWLRSFGCGCKCTNEDGDDEFAVARAMAILSNATVDDFELPNLTPGGAPSEAPGRGPLKLQQHGNPVTYRNIWIVEKAS